MVSLRTSTFVVLLPAAFFLSACSSVGLTGQVGYTQMAVRGDIALTSGLGGVPSSANQDVESAFGLGDAQGSPYGRAQLDLGVPVLTLSAFRFEEQGRGELTGSFGGIPASTPVESELKFTNVKGSLTFDIDLGPVKLSPGLGVDVFDLYFQARETTFGNSEKIDELVPVPLLYLRAEAELGPVCLVAEGGYLDTPKIQDTEGRVLDLEAMLEWRFLGLGEVFVGYRRLDVDALGKSGSDSYDVSLIVDGWTIGGGIRF